jgi:hypothetical protein
MAKLLCERGEGGDGAGMVMDIDRRRCQYSPLTQALNAIQCE